MMKIEMNILREQISRYILRSRYTVEACSACWKLADNDTNAGTNELRWWIVGTQRRTSSMKLDSLMSVLLINILGSSTKQSAATEQEGAYQSHVDTPLLRYLDRGYRQPSPSLIARILPTGSMDICTLLSQTSAPDSELPSSNLIRTIFNTWSSSKSVV